MDQSDPSLPKSFVSVPARQAYSHCASIGNTHLQESRPKSHDLSYEERERLNRLSEAKQHFGDLRGRFRAGNRHCVAFGEVSKPGQLPLGELTAAGLNQFDRLFQRDSTGQMIEDFFVAQRLACSASQTLW